MVLCASAHLLFRENNRLQKIIRLGSESSSWNSQQRTIEQTRESVMIKLCGTFRDHNPTQ